jgi:hypothetical protein
LSWKSSQDAFYGVRLRVVTSGAWKKFAVHLDATLPQEEAFVKLARIVKLRQDYIDQTDNRTVVRHYALLPSLGADPSVRHAPTHEAKRRR